MSITVRESLPKTRLNRLHCVLDVAFADDLSRLGKGHGARNKAVVRHFAFNLFAPRPSL